MLMTSFLELLGVSMIFPLLQMLFEEDSIQQSWYLNFLYTCLHFTDSNRFLLFIGIIIMIVFVVKNGMALWFSYIQQKFSSEFMKEASSMMLDSYMKQPYEYFLNHNSSELLQGIEGDVNAVYDVMKAVFQFLGETVTVILLALLLFFTDYKTAVGSLLIALICLGFIVFGLKNRTKKAGKNFRNSYEEKRKYGIQAIHGIKEITVLNRRQYFLDKFRDEGEKVAKSNLVYGFISSCPDRIIEGVCVSGFIAIVCFRIISGVDTSTFIPALGLFAMGAFKILPSIAKLTNRITTIVFYQPGLHNCYENITSIRKAEKNTQKEVIKVNDDYNELHFQESVLIQNVTWKYINSEINVLDNVSLSIRKGESIALIGASGAGKTTLADVILGLFKPQGGTVLMDGKDIYSNAEAWSKVIGYVPQSVYLIDDTVRANVAFGVDNKRISDERVWSALDQAQIAGFIKNLPNGLNTMVGDRGIRFSGGQKQRIALARALYENPDILVLDEATSALDTETETAVMEAINALQGQKTLIIVAHRLSTIRNCDRIFEIVDGKAVERSKDEVFVD